MIAPLLLALALGQAPDAVVAAADEPPPLSPVYRASLMQSLRNAALPAPAGLVAENLFRRHSRGRHAAVAHALAGILRSDADGDDRAAAARGLGLLRRRADAPVLAQALGDDADLTTRGEAAVALGAIGGDIARRALRDCIAGDAGAELPVRLIAVSALYASGHAAAPAELAALARTVETRPVRQTLRPLRSALHLTPEEWELLGQTDGPPDPRLDRDPAVGRALAEQTRDEDADRAAEARRWLWLRELWLAGEDARRHDAAVARVPAALQDLDATDQDRRLAARRLLTAMAGRDLGAEAGAWRAWWARARTTWR